MAKIEFEAIYPFPLGEWLMPNDFLPVIGHHFQFRTKPAPGFDGIVACEVLELDPPRRLAFSWTGGGIDTVVTFHLAAHGTSTRMQMEQTGFNGLRGLMVRSILKGGWRRMIEVRVRAAAARVHDGLYRAAPTAAESHCHTET